ncbi:hypothetical protein [Streptacidiphilus jiangxiensis]|uniref:Uncharacterized protein n=1 Tax=Streptacidiphilus jiangxiensis TaxID=235985 RepID=A0A1H8B4E4_STRJI|nr:hypothetical protein [Streptacidiphilus jiangxiensis]SEM77781.1 hypothetical protein SAMN05414137_15711 [Streptacidiphilus jiangxiensis]
MGATTFFTIASGKTPEEALENAFDGKCKYEVLPEGVRGDKEGMERVAQGIVTEAEAHALATALEYDSRFAEWWDPIAYVELSPEDQPRFAFFGWMRG